MSNEVSECKQSRIRTLSSVLGFKNSCGLSLSGSLCSPKHSRPTAVLIHQEHHELYDPDLRLSGGDGDGGGVCVFVYICVQKHPEPPGNLSRRNVKGLMSDAVVHHPEA